MPPSSCAAGSTGRRHGETSEALYLNSGFVYDEPETAERRFAGEDDGYVYGRYGNPTVTMFEERLAAAGRGGGLLRAGFRHGGGLRCAGLPAEGRRQARRIQGAVRLLLPDRHSDPAAFRHPYDTGRRQGSEGLAGSDHRRTPNACSWRRPPIRRSRSSTSARSCRDRPRRRGQRRRRQHLRNAHPAEAP